MTKITTQKVEARMMLIKIYIDEKHYEELKKLAEKQKLTIPAYVKQLILNTLKNEKMKGEKKKEEVIEPEFEEKVNYLMKREEQLGREIGKIGIEVALLARRVEKLEQEIRKIS
jgi:rRNA-processing protein FCF1